MSTNRSALVIGLSWEQQPLIDRLFEHGWRLYGVHQQGAVGEARANELANSFQTIHLCDLRDLDSILRFATSVHPDCVVSDQCDYSHFAQAFVATALALPGPSMTAAQISSNKLIQREWSRNHQIDIPEFQMCHDLEGCRAAAEKVGYPLIVKPVDNRGSFGVHRVDDAEQLSDAFLDAMAHSHSRTVLVEEFVVGTHITVDGYFFPDVGCKSLALATKGLLPGTTNQVAVDIIYPGEMAQSTIDKALAINEVVNQRLGYGFGMTHSEYMVTAEERIVLIESANRGGGCFTSQLIVPAVSGVDLVGQLISDVAGESRSYFESPKRVPTLLKFISFPEGKLDRLEGWQELGEREEVIASRLLVEMGDMIEPIKSDAHRHGFVIFSDDKAQTPSQLRATAEDLLRNIRINGCGWEPLELTGKVETQYG